MKSNKRSASESSSRNRLKCSNPEALRWEMQQVQLAIARRAYELFEARNQEHGHDWEDWFRAESELLRPVSTTVHDLPDRLLVHANVLGFEAGELQFSIEPRQVSLLGRRLIKPEDASNPAYYPDLILRAISLEAEIDPGAAMVELQSGILKFDLPKAASVVSKAVAAKA